MSSRVSLSLILAVIMSRNFSKSMLSFMILSRSEIIWKNYIFCLNTCDCIAALSSFGSIILLSWVTICSWFSLRWVLGARISWRWFRYFEFRLYIIFSIYWWGSVQAYLSLKLVKLIFFIILLLNVSETDFLFCAYVFFH